MAMGLSAGFGLYMVKPADPGGTTRTFLVRQGATLKQVAQALEEEGLVTSDMLFSLTGRLMGAHREIRAGEYFLSPTMPPLRILQILSKGSVITHAVTIPEGLTRTQIAEVLAGKGLADKGDFLALTENPELAARFGISAQSLEGYLYPDTYQLARGLPAISVIEVMVRRFWEIFRPLEGRLRDVNLTMAEAITLASIVEKETGLAEERPLIAAVFLNRLRQRMRLESDPTVIYGLERFDGNLTRKDLQEATPYNTYVIHGLPPGPIANPGAGSILAVLYPAETDYLYFVSRNDGSHHFSRTLSEHSRAVVTYQKKAARPSGQRP